MSEEQALTENQLISRIINHRVRGTRRADICQDLGISDYQYRVLLTRIKNRSMPDGYVPRSLQGNRAVEPQPQPATPQVTQPPAQQPANQPPAQPPVQPPAQSPLADTPPTALSARADDPRRRDPAGQGAGRHPAGERDHDHAARWRGRGAPQSRRAAAWRWRWPWCGASSPVHSGSMATAVPVAEMRTVPWRMSDVSMSSPMTAFAPTRRAASFSRSKASYRAFSIS